MDKEIKSKQVVLIADDSSTVRKFVAFSLSTESLEVVTAVDGMDALEKISQIPKVDLIIVDLNMPNMDGITLVRKIRERSKKIPLIMCTTEAEKKRVMEAIRAGVNNYIVKPFTVESLGRKITETLEKARTSAS